MSLYKYQTLPNLHIRVLKLRPGLENDPVSIAIEHIPLALAEDSAGDNEFDAVSYVWGVDQSRSRILVNDSAELTVTPSLHSLLRRLRWKDQPHTLWADAICINQEDTAEKTRQVALMSRIYSAARHVFVDLGEESADCKAALTLMDQYWLKSIWSGIEAGDRNLSPEEAAYYLGVDLPKEAEAVKSVELPPGTDARWAAVHNFFSRPYFSRLWIVQEFILARQPVVLCGKIKIKWQNLVAAAIVYREGPMPVDPSDHMAPFRRWLWSLIGILRRIRTLRETPDGQAFLATVSKAPIWQKFQRARLVDVLHYFQLSDCKEERDQYFSLAAIADDLTGLEPELVPDYMSPILEIINKVGSLVIRMQYGEEMLQRAGIWQQARDGVPTWTQDFAQTGRPGRVVHRTAMHKAAKDTTFWVKTDHRFPELVVVSGLRVDIIDERSSGLDDSTLNSENLSTKLEVILEWISIGLRAFHADPSATYPTGEHAYDAAWKTFICMEGVNDDNKRQLCIGFYVLAWWSAARHKPRDAVIQWAFTRASKHFGAGWDEVSRCFSRYLDLMFQTLMQPMYPGRTRRGYFASLPHCFQPGDEIWVVKGCGMPLLLRKSDFHIGSFRLVGSCYIHGIMNGECVRDNGAEFEAVSIH
ncbi:hypothetical protein GQ53DRAFT_740274 [Thozetella sp. PMI_491]|nr:hypothetical protein GQ53DRAFT_740274 [Thozetella sp. PMI_491]